MSHEINENDKQQGLVLAWHGLTEIVPDLSLDNCFLGNWDVVKTPLLLEGGIPTEYCHLTATDIPNLVIGKPVHCNTYQPITNADFLATIKTVVAEMQGAKIESVGSVCDRGRVFVSVGLAGISDFESAGRKFHSYLNFMNSHDLSAPFSVNSTNIATVCNNTFSANLRNAKTRSGIKSGETNAAEGDLKISLKHTKNVNSHLGNVSEIVESFILGQTDFREALNTMHEKQIDTVTARSLFAGLLVKNENEKISTRKSNQIDRLSELFVRGAGNRGENVADVFNAITDYYTHESSGGENVSRQFVSSEFGSGQVAKSRAFRALQSDDEIAKLCAIGSKALLTV